MPADLREIANPKLMGTTDQSKQKRACARQPVFTNSRGCQRCRFQKISKSKMSVTRTGRPGGNSCCCLQRLSAHIRSRIGLSTAKKLGLRAPPRIRAAELWRVGAEWLEKAQDDATILAIRDQEAAGIDIVTDGEIRRESYSNRFATASKGWMQRTQLLSPAEAVSPTWYHV